MEQIVYPSPTALLADAADRFRDEVERTGRLGPVHQGVWPRDPQGAWLSVVAQYYSEQRWGPCLRWERTDECTAVVRSHDAVLCSAPPTELHLDNGQLHCTTGPAISWSDGTSLCLLRGVLVPQREWRMLQYGTLRASKVLRMRNQAVAAVLMEQIGWDSILLDSSYRCERLDHDERWGTLWRISWPGRWDMEQTSTVLEVTNRSPEPSGSFRHYWLQVDANLRPLVPGERIWNSAPQEMTSLNAVASTFGMTGAQYSESLGEES